jgi:hypothetical protein
MQPPSTCSLWTILLQTAHSPLYCPEESLVTGNIFIPGLLSRQGNNAIIHCRQVLNFLIDETLNLPVESSLLQNSSCLRLKVAMLFKLSIRIFASCDGTMILEYVMQAIIARNGCGCPIECYIAHVKMRGQDEAIFNEAGKKKFMSRKVHSEGCIKLDVCIWHGS